MKTGTALSAAPICPTRLGDLVDASGPVFIQGYGATEAIMMISALDKADHSTGDAAALKRLSSAGRVSPGIELSVNDEEGPLLPLGQTGELVT